MAVESFGSSRFEGPQREQKSGNGLTFSYRDGSSNVQTSIDWMTECQSYKITDRTLANTAVRDTYKADIDSPPSLIRVELLTNPRVVVVYDNYDNKGDLRTIFSPPPSIFQGVVTKYGPEGTVTAGSMGIAEPSWYLYKNIDDKNIDEGFSGVQNEFTGNSFEDNTVELFRRAGMYGPRTLFPYLHIYPDEKAANRALIQGVLTKVGRWDNASKYRAFRELGVLAKEASFTLSPRNTPAAQKQESAWLLGLQSVLQLPDSFPQLSIPAQENPELYEDIFHRTVRDLLQLHENHVKLSEICRRSYYKLGYEIDSGDMNSVQVQFSQSSDSEYGEKAKEGRLLFGEELVWNGTKYRFDRIGKGELRITISPKGVKTAGGEFRYPVINRARMIDGLGSPYRKYWEQAARDAMPTFIPNLVQFIDATDFKASFLVGLSSSFHQNFGAILHRFFSKKFRSK